MQVINTEGLINEMDFRIVKDVALNIEVRSK